MNTKLPCEECLKLAICKHKHYLLLIRDCDDINDMLYDIHRNILKKTVKQIDDLMKSDFYEYLYHVRADSVRETLANKEWNDE